MTSRNKTLRRVRRGFTLFEVLLVLLILAMLATVAIVAFSGTREGARIDVTKIKIAAVEQALDLYNNAMGSYPTDDEGLNALLIKPTFDDEKMAEKWRGPYLKEEALDPWNNPIHYARVEASSTEAGGKPFKLWSNGPDGQDGTEDDIKNWKDDTGQ